MRAMKAIAIAVVLAGCDARIQTSTTDQCMRAELFQACMRSLPAGPASTKYNDWDEVVDSCSTTAYFQAQRRTEHVKPECRPS